MEFSERVYFGPILYFTVTMAAGDIDGDGLDDMLLSSRGDSRLWWSVNAFDETAPVSGFVYYDVDSNGVADPGEPGLPYVPVWSQPDVGSVYTNANGNYTRYLYSGDYELGVDPPGQGWALSSDSASYHVTITAGGPGATGLDFGFKEIPFPPELHVAVAMNQDGCDTEVPLSAHVSNQGPSPVDGVVELVIDPLFTYINSDVPPDSVVGNSIFWSFVDLLPEEPLYWNVSVLSPDVDQIDDPYEHQLEVVGTNSNGLDATFTTSHEGTISCGYDPNAKQVAPPGFGAAGYVDIDQSHLTYTIHFQNTGNDTANTVVLRDVLDHRLEHGSLEVIATTHPFTLELEADGKAVFTFDNIMLPDSGDDLLGSQGHVVFRLALEEGLPSGTLITNSASIFFDNNPSVITNAVNTTLWDCSLFQPVITEGSPFVLNTIPGGLSYQWYLDGEAIPGAIGPAWFTQMDGLYTVAVVDTMGCAAVSDPYAIIGSGIADEDAWRMTARPNPFIDQCEISFSEPLGAEVDLILFDVTGRTQRSIRGNGTRAITIERGSLSAGIYYLRLFNGEAPGPGVHLVLR
jgi:hypothetical protein